MVLFEGETKEVIGEMRVFRKKTAVEIAAKDVSVNGSFGLVLAVVAEADKDFAQGFGFIV